MRNDNKNTGTHHDTGFPSRRRMLADGVMLLAGGAALAPGLSPAFAADVAGADRVVTGAGIDTDAPHADQKTWPPGEPGEMRLTILELV